MTSDPTLDLLTRWGEETPGVRAVILTSTRAVPGGVTDVFSDYDVILVLDDILPYHNSREWLKAFGDVLALYHDPLMDDAGLATSGYVIQFEGGLKIDFTLWPPEMLRRLAARGLDPELDAGYLVLLDKDGLAAALPPPSYRGYLADPPTETEFRECVERFCLNLVYVAKYLRRGDFIAARLVLDQFARGEDLIPMLTWLAQANGGWKVRVGPIGRRLERHLPPEINDAVRATYARADEAENWAALYQAMAAMRQAGQAVGAALGYAYPEEMHEKTVKYLRKIHSVDL